MSSNLHPDQKKFKNFSVSEAQAIIKTCASAVQAVNWAIQELTALDQNNFTAAQKANTWNQEFFHCWWGPWDRSRFDAILFRFHMIKGVLLKPDLRFKQIKRNAGVGLPYTRTIYLKGGFDTQQFYQQMGTIVHEAAHLAGVAVLPIREVYFRHQVIQKAQEKPNFVLRNASNYEHFAVDCHRINVKKANLRLDPPCKKVAVSACGNCT